MNAQFVSLQFREVAEVALEPARATNPPLPTEALADSCMSPRLSGGNITSAHFRKRQLGTPVVIGGVRTSVFSRTESAKLSAF
jgi:hypothetical protein